MNIINSIEVKGVRFRYPGGRDINFPDFTLGKGENCLLLGDSGSGKSTLLHLLGGLIIPQFGSIAVNGIDIASLTERELDQFRAGNIGFIFQKNHLINALDVNQNILLAPFLADIRQDQQKIDGLLTRLTLKEKKYSRPGTISQGQAQRVAIARAVINGPSIILADEPTSALDDKSCNQVSDLLTEIAQEHNASLLIATHDQRLKSQFSKQIVL